MVNDFNGVNLIDAQPQSRVQQWKKLPKCTITGEHGGKPLFKYRLAEDVKKNQSISKRQEDPAGDIATNGHRVIQETQETLAYAIENRRKHSGSKITLAGNRFFT